jgi:hypothetical protein
MRIHPQPNEPALLLGYSKPQRLRDRRGSRGAGSGDQPDRPTTVIEPRSAVLAAVTATFK